MPIHPTIPFIAATPDEHRPKGSYRQVTSIAIPEIFALLTDIDIFSSRTTRLLILSLFF
jgi:hypothetical protein